MRWGQIKAGSAVAFRPRSSSGRKECALRFRGSPCGALLSVWTCLFYFDPGQSGAVRKSWLRDAILSSAGWCALLASALDTAALSTERLRGAIVHTPRGEVAIAAGLSSGARLCRTMLGFPPSNEVISIRCGSVVARLITRQDIQWLQRWRKERCRLVCEEFITAAIFNVQIMLCIVRVFCRMERRYPGRLARRKPWTVSVAIPDLTR